jgi:hypothetical protein
MSRLLAESASCWMAISKAIECCLIGCSECVMITDSVNGFVACIVSLESYESGPLHFTEVPCHSFAVRLPLRIGPEQDTHPSRSRISFPNSRPIRILASSISPSPIPSSIPFQELESSCRALQPPKDLSLPPHSPNFLAMSHRAESPAPSPTVNSSSKLSPQ